MTLFDGQPEEREYHSGNLDNKNPMVRKWGRIEGQKCKTCEYFVVHYSHVNKYFKCTLRGITSGPGTDHRLNYDACKKYKERQS